MLLNIKRKTEKEEKIKKRKEKIKKNKHFMVHSLMGLMGTAGCFNSPNQGANNIQAQTPNTDSANNGPYRRFLFMTIAAQISGRFLKLRVHDGNYTD